MENKSMDTVAQEFAVFLGGAIREARLSKWLSQKKLSQLSGIRTCNISWWENGKVLPSVYSLVRIAHALDLDLKISFGGGESCSPETK